MARAQRRIGTPGLPFWRDLARFSSATNTCSRNPVPLCRCKVDGKMVATLPRNPAQAAAEQQELAEAARTAQILGGMFPEEFKINVDGRKTIDAMPKGRDGHQ
jgi:hypothetical protein